MADWRTYAQAARNTARRQAAEAPRTPREESRPGPGLRDYARAATRAVDEGTRESRTNARRNAAATYVVASRRARRARIGLRLRRALRDAVLMGLSLAAIWFVITRTGAQIPFTAVGAVILVLMVLRFGYALLASPQADGIDVDEDELADEPSRAGGSPRR